MITAICIVYMLFGHSFRDLPLREDKYKFKGVNNKLCMAELENNKKQSNKTVVYGITSVLQQHTVVGCNIFITAVGILLTSKLFFLFLTEDELASFQKQ